jgi:LysM repeat protein
MYQTDGGVITMSLKLNYHINLYEHMDYWKWVIRENPDVEDVILSIINIWHGDGEELLKGCYQHRFRNKIETSFDSEEIINKAVEILEYHILGLNKNRVGLYLGSLKELFIRQLYRLYTLEIIVSMAIDPTVESALGIIYTESEIEKAKKLTSKPIEKLPDVILPRLFFIRSNTGDVQASQLVNYSNHQININKMVEDATTLEPTIEIEKNQAKKVEELFEKTGVENEFVERGTEETATLIKTENNLEDCNPVETTNKFQEEIEEPEEVSELVDRDIESITICTEKENKLTFYDPTDTLNRIKKEYNVTNADIARRVDVTRFYIRDMITGRQLPNLNVIILLCGYYKINLNQWREQSPGIQKAIQKYMWGQEETFEEIIDRLCQQHNFTI